MTANYDKYLNPPDPPTHGKCAYCGGWFDRDDMYERGWDEVCEDCLDEYDLIHKEAE